jgi:hypothetical protein
MTAPALLVLVLAAGAAADQPSLLAPPTAAVVRRCVQGSADDEAARTALGVLRERIPALKDTSDPKPAIAALRSLLRGPCFVMAIEVGWLTEPRHPLALKTWWEHGGESWLWSYLKMPDLGTMPNLRPNVVLPPGMRSVLFRETTPDPQLEPLLCSQAEALCGVETEGWMARARAAVEVPDEEQQRWDLRTRAEMEAALHNQPPPSPEQTMEINPGILCGGTAARMDYTTWRHCLGRNQIPMQALPLGRTRAPKDGWLIIVGRRGHYDFSDEARAYDLTTGAAYIASSSSALALMPGGKVNFKKTDAARQPHLAVGRLASLDNLRETVWMLMLREHAERVAIESNSYPLPTGMTVEFRPNDEDPQAYMNYAIDHGGWNTSWTSLEWRWLGPDGMLRAEGDVTWPTSGNRAETHAAALLDIAERGFVEGCPPATPPKSASPWRAHVNHRDGPPKEFQRLIDGLWRRIVDFTPTGSCH